ncbi:MAG: accessory gene regulator B family protein [Eubacteriales bacterium]
MCLEKMVGTFVEKGHCQEEEKELIIYGLQSAIELFAGILTTIIIGTFLGLLLECIVFLISFWAIRSYSGGFHCKSALICYFASCCIITLTLLVVKFLSELYMTGFSFSLLIVSIPVLLKFAPLETPTKPLDEVEQKYFRKKTTLHLVVESVVICVLIAIDQKVLAFTMCLAVFLSSMVLVAELVRRTFARGGTHSSKLKNESDLRKES